MWDGDESPLERSERELGDDMTFALVLAELDRRAARERHKGSLLAFVRDFWTVLEPERPFVSGWALEAMCQHLEAVTDGRITRLLINVPPGSMKSLLVNVFWPAWEWGPCVRPSLRYISFSYGSHLTERDNQKFLDLISCREYQELYGAHVGVREKGKIKVSNTGTGFKFATSVGGVGTGERGDRVLLDDPHNVKEAESETVRDSTVTWFKEAMSNRLNDMVQSAIVVIMQRVHEGDVSGAIIADKLGYTHLFIPLEFEPDRRCVTREKSGRPFWRDPRVVEGEIFWDERFPPAAVAEIRLLGDHVYAGQYQQRPEPRGGGIIKRHYWRRLELVDNKFPKSHYVLASLDGAFTDKTENDPHGFTIWSAFTSEAGDSCAITLNAWRKHLQLHGNVRPRQKRESWANYKLETSEHWGVIQWLEYECSRWHVDKLLIEDKANGHDVHNEMVRLFGWAKFVVQLVDPGPNDKLARAIRVQPVFAEGLVYTLDEKHGRVWVQSLVDECAIFPRGRYDDQVDSTTQALYWLRKNGYLVMAEERRQILAQQESYDRQKQKRQGALYPV